MAVEEGQSEAGRVALDRRQLLRLAGTVGLAAFSLDLTPEALALERLKAAAAPRRPQLIVLDPGHGGIDPGCIGYSGTYEKDITIAAAREVARLLAATRRYKVLMTRTQDSYVELHERVNMARAAGADLFLSVHADAIPDESVRGASVFTVSEQASDAFAAALAQRENGADRVAGVNLAIESPQVSSILMDLERRRTNNLSMGLAAELVAKLGSQVRMLENSHRAAGFAVLKAPDIPSALVEMGCLSNHEEDRLLRTAAYRSKIAQGIVSSIDAYYSQILKV
jgi:N-acetylmuramoyl-L-alanine amidase